MRQTLLFASAAAWAVPWLSPGWLVVIHLGLAGLAMRARSPAGLQLSLAGVTYSALVGVAQGWELSLPWVIPLLPSVGVAVATRAVVPWSTAPWWRRGTLGKADVALLGAFMAVAGGALVLWWRLTAPDLDGFRDLITGLGWPGLLACALAFATLNPLVEEMLYRGILFEGLTKEAGLRPAMAVVVQAIPFGIAHLEGFPSGFLGMGLAACFGVMMGGGAPAHRGAVCCVALPCGREPGDLQHRRWVRGYRTASPGLKICGMSVRSLARPPTRDASSTMGRPSVSSADWAHPIRSPVAWREASSLRRSSV